MFTLAEYAAAPPDLPGELVTTGLSDLDALTGGIREGDLWVVAGAARCGRTMFAVQVARRAAQQGVPVTFVLGRDPITEVVAQLVSGATREPLNSVRTTTDVPKQVSELPIQFEPDAHQRSCTGKRGKPGSITVVDDLDMSHDPVDGFLEAPQIQGSTARFTTLVTIPTYVLRREDPASWQLWARSADVIIELELPEDGESRINLVMNRRGPIARLDVDIQCHRATIADIVIDR
jgi:hypothetical protein